MTKLIIGCGYLGRRVAAAWLAEGHEVFATTRSEKRAEQLRAEGIQPIVGDLAIKESLPKFPPVESVLHSVGFDRSADQSIEQVYVQGLANVLDAVDSARLKLFFFISSTGVYGQSDGQWVDEQSDCQPRRAGGKACLDAENLLRTHPLGDLAVILRLSGLYGPGRIPRRKEMSDGLPLSVPTEGFLNLIHVDDVVRIILAAERRVTPPDLFLVSDGQPIQRIEYYRELARLINAPEPRFVPPSEHAPSTDRAVGSDKRVCNRRMCEQLEVKLRYPDYREGLSAIIQQESRRDDLSK
jgi:nucleoside-diphosphate-sugar epimerase